MVSSELAKEELAPPGVRAHRHPYLLVRSQSVIGLLVRETTFVAAAAAACTKTIPCARASSTSTSACVLSSWRDAVSLPLPRRVFSFENRQLYEYSAVGRIF